MSHQIEWTLCVAVLAACGTSATSRSNAISGDNLVQDPSFEDEPARSLAPTDQTPWFGEDDDACQIVAGDGRTGSQHARLQPTAGGDAFLYQRFTAQPYTDYTLSFWSRGTPGRTMTASARARFLGDCHTIPQGCPDDDGDEDLDLGPEPPDYNKLALNVATVAGTDDWQLITIAFNSGPYTELGLVFYAEFFGGGDHLDIDDVSVVEAGVSPSCDCSGTDIDGNAVSSSVCGSSVCGQDAQHYDCTQSGYQPTGIPCGVIDDSCEATYGGQEGFQLCFEVPGECGFEAIKNGVESCDDVCAAGGGQCLYVYGNDSGAPCTVVSDKPDGCSISTGYDDICVCSH
jgi:hypothetical protein